MDIQELKDSSKRIGQLYPILVDCYGNIIDGEHRLKADKDWRAVKLENIKTERDLIIARLACNTIRRTVSRKEKSELLGKLAETYLSEGKAIGKITYEVAHQTGMSYRWVAKYLPTRFKDQIQSNKRKKSVARHATNGITLIDPPKDLLKLSLYSNTDFANFLMKKSLFTKLREKAKKLDTTPTTLLYTAIMSILNESNC